MSVPTLKKGGAILKKKKILAAVAAFSFLALLMVPGPAKAGQMTERIRTTVDEALAALRDPALQGDAHRKERRERIREVVEDTIDFEEMTRRSLGVHWRKRTPEERREFVRLFSDLLENSYISKIEQQTDEKVIYLEERENRKGTRGLVKTKVVTSKGTEIPIYYRMMKKKGRWVAYDIVIEGVSLVSNYRTQFGKIIRRSSYEDLVKSLRKKVDKIRSEA
jgi:phospholipid transport system substrate-binding protein